MAKEYGHKNGQNSQQYLNRDSMAKYNFLGVEDLHRIADKLGPWMPDTLTWNACTVAESLEVYTLSASDLLDPEKSARNCLRSTGIWQLQIQVDTASTFFARVSNTEGGNNWQVNSMYGPGLAKKLDKALTWIDQYIHDRFTVRVFEIPAYYIMGLTLENGEDVHVYIVSKAPRVAIETGRLYRFDEMRQILINIAPVQGVNF